MAHLKNVDRLRARDLKSFVTQWRGSKPKGTHADYITVYRDWCRGDGDYSKSHATELYHKHGGEYCTLLQVLYAHYYDHVDRDSGAA